MNKIFLILIFTSLLILVGDKLLLSYVSAQGTSGGLSANSVNKANVTAHIVGKRSNSTSGGLSANSVNKANVTGASRLLS